MASILRFADTDYFLSGNFESDLESDHPILVDPLWKGTKLENHLTNFPLPILTSSKSFCLVTSGSTGIPKMVWKEWSEIEKEISYWEKLPEIQSLYMKADTVHVQVPLCHLYGLLWGYLLPKRLGVSIECATTWEGGKLSITSAPKLQSLLAQDGSMPESAVVSGMKFPVPLSRSLRERGGISILEIYGSTETGGIGYRDPLRQNRFQILTGLDIRLIAEEGVDEKELQIRSPFLSRQSFVLGGQGWTKEELPTNDYYATGDLGNWSELGWYLLGRKDRIIKHNGKRVSLDRIESEILGLSLEGEFVCVPISNEFGQTIGLYSTGTLATTEIIKILRKELPDSHVPRVILKNVSLPKLPNGKPDYQTITKLCNEEYQSIQNQKLNSKTSKLIDSHSSVVEILESILGLKPEPDKHLVYDYGMDSIQYADLILRLEKKIEHTIPEEDKQTSYFGSLSGIEEYIKEKIYLLK